MIKTIKGILLGQHKKNILDNKEVQQGCSFPEALTNGLAGYNSHNSESQNKIIKLAQRL